MACNSENICGCSNGIDPMVERFLRGKNNDVNRIKFILKLIETIDSINNALDTLNTIETSRVSHIIAELKHLKAAVVDQLEKMNDTESRHILVKRLE